MPEPIKALQGRERWLMVPTATSGVVSVVLATIFALFTLKIPTAVLPWIFPLTLGALAPCLVATEVLSARHRRALSRLAAGKVPATPENLQAAVKGLAGLQDFVWWNGIASWLVASSLVAIVLKLVFADVTWELVARLLELAILFGPMNSMLSYFLVLMRLRAVTRQISGLGLSAPQMIEALPPVRAQLRGRLVLFTAICVIAPMVLVADLSSTLARSTFARVLEVEDPAVQRVVAAELRNATILKVTIVAGLVFALAIYTAFVGGTALGTPMRQIAEEAARIARGELLEAKAIPAEDEIWAVSAAFSSMQIHLTKVLSELKRAGTQIGSTTEEIVATSNKYESGAADQATALNETSATTEELARSARQIAENAASVAEIAQKTLGAAEGGQSSADAFSLSMGRMKQDNEAIAGSVVKLSRRVQQIGKIVEFINGVADKSDLLALNAELEGTKAGDVGRGFSLVAAEMRRLAENVIESTKEIEGLIAEIQEATGAAVSATEAGVMATDTGGALAEQVSGSLREIVELAGQTSDAVRSISLATQQQQTGTDQLAEAMADILRVTQQSLAATKQVTTANVELSSLSEDLKRLVERFQIEETT